MPRLSEIHMHCRDELLYNLSGCRYFSTLDMRIGYYQVQLEKQDKPKTAFTAVPPGFYEFNVLPFGLCNAPSTFQRLVERCMGELNMKEIFAFLDDLMIPGRDFEEQLDRLRLVLMKLRLHSLKLSREKCRFFQTRVSYCRHVVSAEGVKTDPSEISRIKDRPVPKNVRDVREFVRFAGYYRQFVKDFSKIARPLNELLCGEQTGKKKGEKPAQEWHWRLEQQKAFETLCQCLTTPPILAYADFSLPFVLHTDACGDGLGAVLCQEQDGKLRVIS